MDPLLGRGVRDTHSNINMANDDSDGNCLHYSSTAFSIPNLIIRMPSLPLFNLRRRRCLRAEARTRFLLGARLLLVK